MAKTASAILNLRDRPRRRYDTEVVGAIPRISDLADLSALCSRVMGALVSARARASVKSFARA